MNPNAFESFLNKFRGMLDEKSDSEKIKFFIDWCNQNGMEEIILRLSSEAKGGWSKNFYLDFTTSRIIITCLLYRSDAADE